MTTTLKDATDYAAWVAGPAAAVYFVAPECGVCGVLRPRIEELFAAAFPRLPLAVVNAGTTPDGAAQAGVFNFPALLVFFEGREFLRKARSFSIGEVQAALGRPYALWLEAAT